jgi:hypothetical protein
MVVWERKERGGIHHQPMHDLKPRRLPIIHRREMPLIPRLPLPVFRLQPHITHLKHPQRHGPVFVARHGLQQAGKQTRAHDLVLYRLRVREPDGRRAVVLAVEQGEILVVAAEDEGEGLGPAGEGAFLAHDVGEAVGGEFGGDKGGFVGVVAGEGVEAILGYVLVSMATFLYHRFADGKLTCYGEVFHDVRFV